MGRRATVADGPFGGVAARPEGRVHVVGSRRAVLHCDAGSAIGMGHLMRSLAIAETARSRGWETRIVGDIDERAAAAAARISPATPVRRVSAASLLPAVGEELAEGAEVLHLDTYRTMPAFRDADVVVSTMQDGVHGARPADLAVDAALGSESAFARPEDSRVQLAGLDACVIREQVLRRRTAAPDAGERPRVLIVIGGTDPMRLTARITRALDVVPTDFDVTVVDPAGRAEVVAAADALSRDVAVVGFVDDLPALARAHDLVISAAGTSVWDFACMGLPMAIVCAADNQVDQYRRVLAAGLVHGLGEPPHRDLEDRVRALAEIIADAGERARQAARLRSAVDGLGTWRIVSAWEQLVEVPASAPATPRGLTARPAGLDDARLLLAWRSDPATRAASRVGAAPEWPAHQEWVRRTLARSDRLLTVVEDRGEPVGTVRWDASVPDGDSAPGTGAATREWEASITLAPEARGRGLAAEVLSAGEGALSVSGPHRLLATIHRDNAASRRLFARSGYLPHRPEDESGFLTMAKWRRLGSGLRADPS